MSFSNGVFVVRQRVAMLAGVHFFGGADAAGRTRGAITLLVNREVIIAPFADKAGYRGFGVSVHGYASHL
jgi:hypothetical protein